MSKKQIGKQALRPVHIQVTNAMYDKIEDLINTGMYASIAEFFRVAATAELGKRGV